MPAVHRVSIALIILLGVVNIAVAPIWFDEFAMRVMWYVAQGLMAVCLGLVNIMAIRSRWLDRVTARLCHTANVLGLTFGVTYSLVDPTPPSYAAIVIMLGLLVGGLSSGRRTVGGQ